MSYEIVKGVKIDELSKKVWIKGSSNNVYPKTYEYWECSPLSKMLKEKGKQQVEITILEDYETGNFQAGVKNKYWKALQVLHYVFKEEYKKFSWNVWGLSEEKQKELDDLRKSEEFKDLLLKCLNYKYPKTKFVIYKMNWNDKVYAKVNKTCIKWKYTKEEATKYNFEEEAEDHIYNSIKDVCSIEEITK